MAEVRIDTLIEKYWQDSREALIGLDFGAHARLNTAVGAVDAIWDRHVFVSAETFGGIQIGHARALTGALLRRFLVVEYAALVSVGGTDIPPTGNAHLDSSLASACQHALDTFSGDLLGPVRVADALVYAKPILLDSPVPIGAVMIACRRPISSIQGRLLSEFLRHFDTRLSLAERLLQMRRRTFDFEYEIKRLKGEVRVPEPVPRRLRELPGKEVERSMAEIANSVRELVLFGVSLPSEHFGSFCHNYDLLTHAYLTILENAEHLFLDVPSAIDAKNEESKLAAPYFRLLGVMGSLREATRLLFRVTADDLVPDIAMGRAPTFADLTRIAKGKTTDETTGYVLEIMNDRGEDAELDALAARSHPYEFRAANTGEVFALLALYETLKELAPDGLQSLRRRVTALLRKYQAARAYLLSYDRFEDVPLKGGDRTKRVNAEKLLLHREGAPAFDFLLAAVGGKGPSDSNTSS